MRLEPYCALSRNGKLRPRNAWTARRRVRGERMDQIGARAGEAAARARESDARFEKRMKDFERIGIKEIVELRRLHRENEHKINALIDSQQRTEAALRAFMDSLRRGG